jgi:hypothetical protein
MAIPTFSPIPVNQGGRFGGGSFTPGASRIVDYRWPNPIIFKNTAAVNTTGFNRLLNVSTAVATGGFGGGAAVLNNSNSAILGCVVVTLAAGGADGVGQLMRFDTGTAPGIFMTQLRAGTALIPDVNSDYACGRVYATYAYGAGVNGGGLRGSGIELTLGGGIMFDQNAAGVGFCRTAANTIQAVAVAVSGGGSSTLQVTSPATFNDQILHTYEIQTQSATAATDASITWLIDGVVVRQLFYLSNLLPKFSASAGGESQFTLLLPCTAANTVISCYEARLIQAPNIASCY